MPGSTTAAATAAVVGGLVTLDDDGLPIVDATENNEIVHIDSQTLQILEGTKNSEPDQSQPKSKVDSAQPMNEPTVID